MALGKAYTGDWLQSGGSRIETVVVIAFDNSYPTGGEPLTKAELGLSSVDSVVIPSVGGYVFNYDYINEKVLVYVEEGVAAGGPLLEVANATDLSALTGVRVIARGC